MTHRPAVTLMEVLIAMFIMAIGMLALLTLFPLGALSMAQALKDDRCANTASMAENVAIAMNVCHDSVVLNGFGLSTTTPPMVYVDPYGVLGGLGSVQVGGVIPRVSTSFASSLASTDRWFSLPDDITFLANGTLDTSSSFIDRGRRYSYAYLLRQMSPNLAQFNLIQLYVVVYSGRPVNSLATANVGTLTFATTETPVTATVLNPNSLQLGPPPSGRTMTIERGGWVFDPNNGYFYRVTNLADAGGGNTTVDVQPNLIGNPTQVVVMDNVAEVFDKGSSWQP